MYVGRVLQIRLVAKFLISIWLFIMANEYHMHYVVGFKGTLLLCVNTMVISSIPTKKVTSKT